MEAAEREVELFLNHARLAGYLEGIAPQSSSWTDNHFERVIAADEWAERGMPFLGRVVVTFDPDGPHDGGVEQLGEYEVHRLPTVAGNEPELVTDSVIVLRRAREATRQGNDWYLFAEPELPARPLDRQLTAEDMVAFQKLALHPHVQEVAFGPAKTRDGWEIDFAWLRPLGNGGNATVTVNGQKSTAPVSPMGVGGHQTVYGETFRDAVEAALAQVEAPFIDV
jgi:hypothetical protein